MIKKYLGLDYGTKRIGLAIGDSETKTAVPFDVVDNVGEVADVVKKEGVDVVVVGKPYSIVNKEHPMSGEFNKFVGALRGLLSNDVEVVFEDERLSSKYADSLPGDKKTKASRDEIAAMSILQGYLDKKVK